MMHLPIYQYDAVVVGSGCAGFNAADSLYDLGVKNIALVTEGINMGTSRNTGSDKQTYYKLSLADDQPDSVQDMAETLFAGGGMEGETALCEAAGSARAFMKLVGLGVPFPTNRYGEYVGYQTDHDVRKRATSVGPLTSKYMTEALEASVLRKDIPILDQMLVIQVLTEENQVKGLLCINKKKLTEEGHGLTVIFTEHVILCTGGPAGCYEKSVYPTSQSGMTGLAIQAGAAMNNMQEWQYGTASIGFRWNVSGTYQQVIPRYISIDEEGREREFLFDYLEKEEDAYNLVFMKGYQWPFDTGRIDASSLVDLAVYMETEEKGRKVYMDYLHNPKGFALEKLSEEAYHYLEQSGALEGLPIDRLKKMNPAAIELYRSHNIDITKEYLEIGVCAQHNNGGIKVDADWATNVQGLYAAGEAAGTFGSRRPGGTALNSTQVGSMRAAEAVADRLAEGRKDIPEKCFGECSEDNLAKCGAGVLAAIQKTASEIETMLQSDGEKTPAEIWKEIRSQMTACASFVRIPAKMKKLSTWLEQFGENPGKDMKLENPYQLVDYFKVKDVALTCRFLLNAMGKAAEVYGSRGSALVIEEGGTPISEAMSHLTYKEEKKYEENLRLETSWTEEGIESKMVPVQKIPTRNNWFETVWMEDRERREKRK